MGLFDRFKQTPGHPPTPEAAPAAQESGLVVEPTLDRSEVLSLLLAECPGGEIAGEWLLYREHDLRVTVEFGSMQSNPDKSVWSVQLLLIAQHPFFDEDLVESVVGVGKDPDDAIRNGAHNICIGVLPFVTSAFGCDCDNWIETDIMGRHYRFRIPCMRGNVHAGSGEPTDLWELVKDELPHYLGTKRCYWLKLFSACVNGVPNCEARVNGTVYPELTDLLYKDAARHHGESGYRSDKVFVLLIQDERTYTPCSFTKQEVGEMAFRAMRLFQKIEDEESARKTQAMIVSLAPTRDLGLELLSFLPEAFACQVVQYRDSDKLMPVINRGKPEHVLTKAQVRSYGYIEDAVFQYLHKVRPSEEEIKQLLAVSAKFHALSEGIENGAKLEDLRLSPLVYFVDEHYRVW